MTQALDVDVLVVGAGPTGLMLANWLRRFGVDVVVIDPKSGPTRESRAVILQARSFEIYDQLGLGDRVANEGRSATQICLWGGAKKVGQLVVGALGEGLTPHPYVHAFEQSQNESLLAEAFAQGGEPVRWGHRLVAFQQDESGLQAQVEGPEGQAFNWRTRYLCGADGSHSTVRHALGVPFEGSTNPHHFYVADAQASGAFDACHVNLKLSPEGFLLVFPLKGESGPVRLIGALPAGAEGEPDFERDVRPVLRAQFGVEVQAVNWFSRYRVHHRVASQFRKGRAFLLGDAAHVHSPVGGQGMNTGLSDAHNLAWKLAAVCQGQAQTRLLDSYEDERQPFAQALIHTTDRAFSVVSDGGWLAQQIRGHLVPALVDGLLPKAQDGEDRRQSNPVTRFLFGVVSQTAVRYEASGLNSGQAGAVRGGERLPYLELAAGGSNFDFLREAKLHLQICGQPSELLAAWADHEGLPLVAFPLDEAAKAKGFAEGAAYLIRPDGYVSLALAEPSVEALRAHLRDRLGWREPVTS